MPAIAAADCEQDHNCLHIQRFEAELRDLEACARHPGIARRNRCAAVPAIPSIDVTPPSRAAHDLAVRIRRAAEDPGYAAHIRQAWCQSRGMT